MPETASPIEVQWSALMFLAVVQYAILTWITWGDWRVQAASASDGLYWLRAVDLCAGMFTKLCISLGFLIAGVILMLTPAPVLPENVEASQAVGGIFIFVGTLLCLNGTRALAMRVVQDRKALRQKA